MKSLIFIFLLVGIIAFVGCISAPAKAATYTIEISGTNGLAFFGHYGGITLEGETVTQSVDGKVPTTYTVKGTSDTIVYCSFKKQVEAGTLNVQIFKDGQLATQGGTAEPFGTVILLTN
jgi:hypothetical protein